MHMYSDMGIHGFLGMHIYSEFAYLVCTFAVILAYMDFEVCVYAGDPNCRKIYVCGFTVLSES